MRYIYNRQSLPPARPDHLRRLEQAAGRVAMKVEALAVEQLPLSAYGKKILADVQKQLNETMKKYVHIMAWAFYPDLPGGHQVFVDYGGGHGLLACLAKEAGVPRVIYNDIFAGCCEDARTLAQHVDCPLDAYVCGDIHTLRESLERARPSSCALVSINVIEHMYDINDFIKVATALASGPMTMVLSTSANPLNPIVKRRHYRQHSEWELEDGPHESSYPMDTVKAFRSVRRDIIKECAPQLSETDVEALADATRGLRKDDIERCVRQFETTKIIPVEPEHPTNTCDPLTGSWQERLLDIESVSRTFKASGLSARVLGGYYNETAGHPAKRAAAYVINRGISLLGRHGARLSPCVMFHAARS